MTVRNVMLGGTGNFSYLGTPSGSITVNSGSLTAALAPGSYATTQVPLPGWTLLSITCDDSDSTGALATATATFIVAPGEHVTCTFTNTRAALTISDPAITEGDSGTQFLVFSVARSAGVGVHSVQVDYATQDVTAEAGTDYTSVSGTLTIGQFSAHAVIVVPVHGDTTLEPNEMFQVNLSNPRNAVLEETSGIGSILNDDSLGGRGLRITTGPVVLTWQDGNVEAGYRVYRVDVTSGIVDLLPAGPPLAADARTYADATAAPGHILCYFVTPVDAAGTLLGLSDALCAKPGDHSGPDTPLPENFTLGLDQDTAIMTWTPPVGGVSGYGLLVLPLNGTPPYLLSIEASATDKAIHTGGVYHCFILLGVRSGSPKGNTDPLCALPGVSALADHDGDQAAGAVTAGWQGAAAQLQAALP